MLLVCALLPIPADAGQFGTGFAVSPEGYVVTCFHVVRGAERIVIHLDSGYLDAKIVAFDPQNDLAVLKVEDWPGRYLGLSSSREVTHASEILAAGFPDPSVLGRNPKISTGIVNALSGVRDDPRYVQISAPVQPGNSGGPLLSPSGRAVGVVASGLNSMDRMTHGGYLPQSVNFAIKSDLVIALLKSASISVPKLGTRTPSGPKQVERAIGSIALIEALRKNEPVFRISPPAANQSPGVTPRLFAASGGSAETISSNGPGPWVFPDSHLRSLKSPEVECLPKETLWRARNEIYLRHGFIFPTAEGQRFANEFGSLYRPVTNSVDAVKRQLSPVEVHNLQLINRFE